MTTLKNRLRRVADTISKTYAEAKRTHRFSGSRSSISSTQSSRASFSSIATTESSESMDSLRSLRNSMMQRTSLLSNAHREQHQYQEQQQQQQQQQQHQYQEQQQLQEQHQHQPHEMQTASSNGPSTQLRNSFSGSMVPLNSIPEASFLELGGDSGKSHSTSNAGQGQQGQGATNSASVSQGLAAAVTAGNSGSSPARKKSKEISELERQKAINAKLQQQIQDNIRRQEELVRHLQAKGQAPAPSAPTPPTVSSAGSQPTNNTTMHMQGNHNAMNLMAGPPFGMNFYGAQNALQNSQLNTNGLTTLQAMGGLQASGISLNNFLLQGSMGMQPGSLGRSASEGGTGMQPGSIGRSVSDGVVSNPRFSMLFGSNPSLFAAAQQQHQHQQQHQQSMLRPLGASSAPIGGLNPLMPPPQNTFPGNPTPAHPSPRNRGGRSGDEPPDTPLSPGSFHW
jgi:hypothetical protein